MWSGIERFLEVKKNNITGHFGVKRLYGIEIGRQYLGEVRSIASESKLIFRYERTGKIACTLSVP